MINGILKIWLEHIIPEDKKPKIIDITDEPSPKTASNKKFLSE
jgi:hypothetical protein